MRTHPLWHEFQPPSATQIAQFRVNPDDQARWNQPVIVVPADPTWAEQYLRVANTIDETLGAKAHNIEHVGSTSVTGLAAKPVIDVHLEITDPADEDSYLPELTAAGFELVIRNPDREQPRALKWFTVNSNVHVYAPGAVEPRRQVAFRNWLRAHPDDLNAYAALKLSLSHEGFTDVMSYNNRKAALIYDIYEKIFIADANYRHDPHPRQQHA